MKSKIITSIFSIALVTIGLCSSTSQANDEKSLIKSVAYSASDIAVKHVSEFVKQGKNNISTLKTNTYGSFINHPLLNLSTSGAEDYIKSQNFTKKNKLFELANVFNDKLQQILVSFSLKKPYKYKNNYINKDVSEDKNAINCKVKK